MEIREEIEKLKKELGDCESWSEMTTYNGAVYAVLRILDEHLGELVTEIVCDEEMEFELVWDTKMKEMIPKIFRLGDHISIYVSK